MYVYIHRSFEIWDVYILAVCMLILYFVWIIKDLRGPTHTPYPS